MEDVTEFEAECMVYGWKVNHSVGCSVPAPGLAPGLVALGSLAPGLTALGVGPDIIPPELTCENLTLSEIRCLQLCPEPNGTLSTIIFDSEEVMMSHYEIENKVLNEVETNISFTCKDESKNSFTQL